MSSSTFHPHLASTPKKVDSRLAFQNLCSTPVPTHVRRCSLAKCAPRPVDSSTPQTRRHKKAIVPELHRLLLPSGLDTNQNHKIWVL